MEDWVSVYLALALLEANHIVLSFPNFTIQVKKSIVLSVSCIVRIFVIVQQLVLYCPFSYHFLLFIHINIYHHYLYISYFYGLVIGVICCVFTGRHNQYTSYMGYGSWWVFTCLGFSHLTYRWSCGGSSFHYIIVQGFIFWLKSDSFIDCAKCYTPSVIHLVPLTLSPVYFIREFQRV